MCIRTCQKWHLMQLKGSPLGNTRKTTWSAIGCWRIWFLYYRIWNPWCLHRVHTCAWGGTRHTSSRISLRMHWCFTWNVIIKQSLEIRHGGYELVTCVVQCHEKTNYFDIQLRMWIFEAYAVCKIKRPWMCPNFMKRASGIQRVLIKSRGHWDTRFNLDA